MKKKICIAIMFGLICFSIFSGCGLSSNEKQTDFEELEVDYVVNDDGTYTCNDLIYNYKFEDITYSLVKSEISIDDPQFIILCWY